MSSFSGCFGLRALGMCCGDCRIIVGGEDYGPWGGGVDELALLELAGFFRGFLKAYLVQRLRVWEFGPGDGHKWLYFRWREVGIESAWSGRSIMSTSGEAEI